MVKSNGGQTLRLLDGLTTRRKPPFLQKQRPQDVPIRDEHIQTDETTTRTEDVIASTQITHRDTPRNRVIIHLLSFPPPPRNQLYGITPHITIGIIIRNPIRVIHHMTPSPSLGGKYLYLKGVIFGASATKACTMGIPTKLRKCGAACQAISPTSIQFTKISGDKSCSSLVSND